MNLCSPPTLHSTNTHQHKRKAQRTPSRSTSPSGHNNHHLPSHISSLEIKVNSLQQSLSKLDEHTTTLINNQQAVLRVLTTMALPPSLATYLAPLYNRVYAKTKKEASKRSFERIVRRSFHFIGSFKLQKSVRLPN